MKYMSFGNVEQLFLIFSESVCLLFYVFVNSTLLDGYNGYALSLKGIKCYLPE